MPGGLGAKSRHKALKARAKKAQQKLEKLVGRLPTVTEHDLFAFQLQHFGDASQPTSWFVAPEQALMFEPFYEELDDGLGFYDDGVKRTLTDAQIEIFRQKELWELERANQKQQSHEVKDYTALQTQTAENSTVPTILTHSEGDRATPARHISSADQPPPFQRISASEETRDVEDAGSNSSASRKRRRSREIPYDQRHKRQWEGYVAQTDPIEGALTSRRIARELDEVQTELIEMDY